MEGGIQPGRDGLRTQCVTAGDRCPAKLNQTERDSAVKQHWTETPD